MDIISLPPPPPQPEKNEPPPKKSEFTQSNNNSSQPENDKIPLKEQWSEHFFDKFKETVGNRIDYGYLSANPNITSDIVQKYNSKNECFIEGKCWDYRELSKNPSIKLDFIQENINKPWIWYELSKNPYITFEFVKENKNKNWDWEFICLNEDIINLEDVNSLNDLIADKDIKLNWKGLSRNPVIIRFIEEDIKKGEIKHPWKWSAVGQNPNVSLKIVEYMTNIDFFRSLSKNPNITMDMVNAYPDKPWDWYGLSRNPNITMDFIETKSDKPWDWDGLSRNPNITMDFIEANLDKPWDWEELASNNKYITMKFLEDNNEKFKKGEEEDWEWYERISIAYCTNPHVVPDISNNFYKDIANDSFYEQWQILSNNPNITFEFLDKKQKYNPWDWEAINKNIFKYEKQQFMQDGKRGSLMEISAKSISDDERNNVKTTMDHKIEAVLLERRYEERMKYYNLYNNDYPFIGGKRRTRRRRRNNKKRTSKRKKTKTRTRMKKRKTSNRKTKKSNRKTKKSNRKTKKR